MEERNNLNIENEAADKKAKKKWSKKKKAGVSFLVIILLAAITAINFLFVAPTLYLSIKYHESPFEYNLVEIIPPKKYLVWNPAGYMTSKEYIKKLTNIEWNFEIGDETVEVEFNKKTFRYYDFRQLEEIEQLATEYLQKNIDSRISGIEITQEQFYNYGNNYINASNIEGFLCSMNYKYYREPVLPEDDDGWQFAIPILYTYTDDEEELDEIKKNFLLFNNNKDFWNSCCLRIILDKSIAISKYIQLDPEISYNKDITIVGYGFSEDDCEYLMENKLDYIFIEQ